MGIPKLSGAEIVEIRTKMGISKSRPVIIASIYDEKEAKQVADMFSTWPKENLPLLIFGCRFPIESSDTAFARLYQSNLKVGTRADKDMGEHFDGLADGQPFGNYDVVILNTIGELPKLYAVSNVAILASSRNPMEPALYNVPFVYLDQLGRSRLTSVFWFKRTARTGDLGNIDSMN